MATWSGIRKKLEEEYLAKALCGHIKYYVTTYKKCHDREGRAAILLDGEELIRGCYLNVYSKAHLFPHDEKYNRRISEEFPYIDETAVKLGVFDQRCFYRAFEEFDSQSIDESLKSDDLLVRIFAVLDRRVGKRRLIKIRSDIKENDEVFNMFYSIRASAENI